ncbi:MAG: response regulator transcription factor [Planctomycetaceae bacterium]|nr:response regulator transcription factor [Planctomycetaceae bacterium]
MDKKPITCVFVDDHEMVLEALVAQFQRSPRIRVVGTAGSVDEMLPLLGRTAPDVLVVDVNLPGRDIFDVAADLKRRWPETRILILTGFLADIFIEQALKQGIAGYLLKSEPLKELVSAIERVAAGEPVFSKAVAERLTFDPGTSQYVVRHESDLSALTLRQLEVLRHLACGQSVKEISTMMKLSQKSVDSHKYRIMNKLGIHDRVLLARFAIREGLMVP